LLSDNNTKRQRFGATIILDYTSDFVDLKLFNVFSSKIDSSVVRDFTSNFAGNNFEDDFFLTKTKTEQRTNSLQALFKFSGTELPVSLSYTKGTQTSPNSQEFTFLQSGLSAISASTLVYGQPADLIHLMGVLNPSSVNTTLTNMLINNTSLNDAEYDAKIDWKIPFKFSDSFSGKLATGGKYHTVDRISNNSQIYDYLLFGAGAGNRTDLVNQISYLKSISGYNTSLQAGLPAYPWVDASYGRSSILGYPIGPSFDVYKLASMQNYYYGLNATTNRYWNSGPNDYSQDYIDREYNTAGYLMGEFNIGNSLTVVAGARWQQEMTYISAYHIQINTSNQNGLSGVPPVLYDSRRTNAEWYPSINVKYKATDNVQIVGAAYKSVSLPSYSDISPLVELQQNVTIVSGNPLLKPSTAWNLEIGASVFDNFIGLFTANFFYKDLKNLIYNMQNYYPFSTYPIVGAPTDIAERLPSKSYYDTTWAKSNRGATLAATVPMNNPDDAYLRGIELSWQTHLWYLPGVLSGLVLDLNASWMSSKQMYPSFKVVGPTVGNKDTLVYTTTSGSLQNQPKAIYNAILGWDYKGFSSRFSLSYQQTTLSSVDTRYALEDYYTDNITLLDISIKQQILDNCSVFANMTNINNHIDNYYFTHPTYTTATKTYPTGNLPTSGQTYGWILQVGITYNY
jgi:TonB-dependent receptor